MKKLLIASATVVAISIAGYTIAQPAGPTMRHHEPVKEIVKHLRGLSLTDSQREEIKTLVSAFKDANPKPERADIEEIEAFNFATATEAQISEFIQAEFEKRENKHYVFAQFRHDIFNVLNDEQKAIVLVRANKKAPSEQGMKGRKFALRMAGAQGNKGHRGRGPKSDDAQAPMHGKGPFGGITLSEEQIDELAALRASFEETASGYRETLLNFKVAQRELVQSENFSEDAWNTLLAEYKDDIVSAGVAKAKHHQAMFAVLTETQQAELKAKRDDERTLMEIFQP